MNHFEHEKFSRRELIKKLGVGAVGLGLFVVAGCNPFTRGTTGNTKIKSELIIWHWETPPQRAKVIEDLGKRFSDETGIKVKYVPINYPDYNTKLISVIGTDSMPDIIFANPPQMMLLHARNLLVPIDDLFNELNSKVKFFEASSLYKMEGKQWGIPMYAVTWPMTYRKDLHQAAGYDQAPQTWKELLARAEKMHSNERPGFYLPVSTNGNYGNQVVWGFLRSNGAQIVDGVKGDKVVFQSKQTIETYTFLKELAKFNGKGTDNADWGSTELLVRNGKVNTLVYNGAPLGDLLQQDKNLELAQKYAMGLIPRQDTSVPHQNTGYIRSALVTTVAQERGRMDAAKQWLQWISEPDNHAEFLLSGPALFMPTDEAIAKSKVWSNHEFNRDLKSAIDVMIESVKYISVQGMVGQTRSPQAAGIEGSLITSKVLQKIMLEKLSVEDAVAWGHAEFEKVIKA